MDMILVNGKVYTMDKDGSIKEAVAIKNNKIIKVGSSEEILSLKNEDTKVVDLEGKAMVPGFNDSHMHLLNCGNALRQVQLVGADSMDEIKRRVEEYIEKNQVEEGQWIRGRGWNQDNFKIPGIFPTRYDLDKISTKNPIVLTRVCGHALVTNSKALEMLGIDENTAQVEGGHFDLDENGVPLGIFRENATGLVHKSMTSVSIPEIKDMIVVAIEKLTKEGITSVGSDDLGTLTSHDYEKVINAYLELKEEGKLNVRVYEQSSMGGNKNRLQDFVDKGYKTGWGDEYFKIGPLKVFLDGSLGARTAALMEPYSDDSSTKGIVILNQDELDELIELAHVNDIQVAVHGIGDKTMYMAFESIEKALEKKPRKDHRHGIVHCQITDEHLLNEFKRLDAIAYIQPIFLDYDWKIVEDRVGKERMKTSYNWKTMLDKGVKIACGSDAPVETFNVLYGIYEAVTRKDLDGNPEGGWLIDQALTVEEAVYGYTMGGAYASFEEDIKGSIEEGKLADMVVLSQNIFEIHEDSIKDVEVEMTIFDGKIIG